LLAKQSSKEKVLDLYTTAIARESAKLTKSKNETTTKTSKKRKIKDEASDSDSDDLSVNMIEGVANITIDGSARPNPRSAIHFRTPMTIRTPIAKLDCSP
jgi:hypothetical protein